ncbi:hypothetical protein [Methylobacterium sp. 1973]|uniref:hypothetical protein n=1 Tax=Methylobacterium sp. 1973 TaxID=3156421 RepID=UPI003392B9C4
MLARPRPPERLLGQEGAVGAAAGQTAALVEAANRPPIVCEADIVGACGTCGRRV